MFNDVKNGVTPWIGSRPFLMF